MPLVTFTNPEYKDKTVYAVAGSHKETILSLAKENKIQLDFNCEDGECGSCLIEVKRLKDDGAHMGAALTQKEQTVLKELGKYTKDQIDEMVKNDQTGNWRLACQYIVRDEEIIVKY